MADPAASTAGEALHATIQTQDQPPMTPTSDSHVSPHSAAEDFPALAAMGHGTRGRLSALVAVLVSGESPDGPENCGSLPLGVAADVADANTPEALSPAACEAMPCKQTETCGEGQEARECMDVVRRTSATATPKEAMTDGGYSGHSHSYKDVRREMQSVHQESQIRNDALSVRNLKKKHSGLVQAVEWSGDVPASHGGDHLVTDAMPCTSRSRKGVSQAEMPKASATDDLMMGHAHEAGPSKRVTRASYKGKAAGIATAVAAQAVDAPVVKSVTNSHMGFPGTRDHKRRHGDTAYRGETLPTPSLNIARRNCAIKRARLSRRVSLKSGVRSGTPSSTNGLDNAAQVCALVSWRTWTENSHLYMCSYTISLSV